VRVVKTHDFMSIVIVWRPSIPDMRACRRFPPLAQLSLLRSLVGYVQAVHSCEVIFGRAWLIKLVPTI
jgi:hypothetical protein